MNLLKLEIKDAYSIPDLRHTVSTYDMQSGMLRDGFYDEGLKLVTFAPILKHGIFPLAEILSDLLSIGQKEMNNHIEIEFALNMSPRGGTPKMFNFLQIRPIVDTDQSEKFNWEAVDFSKAIIFSNSALGHGLVKNIQDFVYVKPDRFNPAKTIEIAREVEEINNKFIELQRNYVLVGPGGGAAATLGGVFPIKWVTNIGSQGIVEIRLDSFRVDPSQGTTFLPEPYLFWCGLPHH